MENVYYTKKCRFQDFFYASFIFFQLPMNFLKCPHVWTIYIENRRVLTKCFLFVLVEKFQVLINCLSAFSDFSEVILSDLKNLEKQNLKMIPFMIFFPSIRRKPNHACLVWSRNGRFHFWVPFHTEFWSSVIVSI